MSFYNMINGVKQATFTVLPMLGKHPDSYPRFRDCFLYDEDHPEYDKCIQIYTRTGGGNRESYWNENQEMKNMPGYIIDFDDSFDSTYASWIFEVPKKWESDFEHIFNGEMDKVSDEYVEYVKKIYPTIVEKIDKLFMRNKG